MAGISSARETNGHAGHGAAHAATTLALWSSAFASGVSADHTLAALPGIGEGVRGDTAAAADAAGLPGPGEPSGTAADLLTLMRLGGPAQLVLPVPGDLRGLPAGGEIVTSALAAGAAVVFTGRGVALVPVPGHWRAYLCATRPEPLTEHDARVTIAESLSAATDRLLLADVAQSGGDPRRRVERLLGAMTITAPPGMPGGAASLLNQAIHLDAILAVARADRTAAAGRHELAEVDEALVPLYRVARDARCAAVAIAARALHPAAARPVHRPARADAATRPIPPPGL